MGNRQSGITLIGFAMILALVIFFGYIAMRLFPMYSEYYSVVQAMEGLARDPDISQATPAKVRDLLSRRLDTSYVDSVKREHVKISKRDGYTVHIAYEVRVPLFGNLHAVGAFENTVDLLEHDQ